MTGTNDTSGHSQGKQAVRTWLRLLSCEKTIEQRLRSRFRDHFTVTLPQFDVLSELQRAGKPLTMSQLSGELMVSNGNITGVVDRLEKAGYVTRDRSPTDRRIQFIALSGHGLKEFRRMARRHERWVDELLSGLSHEDLAGLQALLLKARHSVTAATRE